MAKANPYDVNWELAQLAVSRAKSRNAVYSQCVKLSYQSTGRLAPGFDNKDLQAWIDEYMPDTFDEKGNKK
jgi:hypothetical protein